MRDDNVEAKLVDSCRNSSVTLPDQVAYITEVDILAICPVSENADILPPHESVGRIVDYRAVLFRGEKSKETEVTSRCS